MQQMSILLIDKVNECNELESKVAKSSLQGQSPSKEVKRLVESLEIQLSKMVSMQKQVIFAII